MAKIALNPGQLAVFRATRHLDADTRRAANKQLFEGYKRFHGIPLKHRIKVEVDDTSNPNFGIIIRKKTGTAYDAPAANTPARWFPVSVAHGVVQLKGATRFDAGVVQAPTGFAATLDGYSTVTTSNALMVKLTDAQFNTHRA